MSMTMTSNKSVRASIFILIKGEACNFHRVLMLQHLDSVKTSVILPLDTEGISVLGRLSVHQFQ